MTTTRHSSTDSVNIPGWGWQPFLEDAVQALQPLNLEPYPVANDFLYKQDQTGSKAKPITVTTATWACKTDKFRQVRAACVYGGTAASVLNFVINPSARFDLPFFGGDLVTLPSGHLLALDLQPADKSDEAHTQQVWEKLIPIFERWRSKLPDGGPIPEEAQPFFSPGFLWTRLPLGDEGDQLINSVVRQPSTTTSAFIWSWPKQRNQSATIAATTCLKDNGATPITEPKKIRPGAC